MAPEERRTFYLYSIGHPPEQLALGHVVMGDYANPTQGLYIPQTRLRAPELEQHVYSTQFSGQVDRSGDIDMGFSVQVPAIAETTLEFAKSNATAMVAGDGRRIVLKDPRQFLCDQVLTDDPARETIQAWLTAANSALVRAKACFRSPKIWFLTGLYELKDVCFYDSRSARPSVTLAADAGLISALTAAPVGASVNLSNGATATSVAKSQGPAVWAGQWQRIDVKYLRAIAEPQKAMALPLQLKLLKDSSYSSGTLLGSNDNSDAIQIDLKGVEDDDGDAHGESGNDEYYRKMFDRAFERIKKDHERSRRV